MGQRDIRTLLVSGAMAVLQAVERFDTPSNDWLTRSIRWILPGLARLLCKIAADPPLCLPMPVNRLIVDLA